MSLAKLKAAAAATTADYVSLPIGDMHAALVEAGVENSPGSVADIIAREYAVQKVKGRLDKPAMLHRDAHLKEILDKPVAKEAPHAADTDSGT